MSVNKFKAVNIVIQCKQTCDLYDALLLNYYVLKCSISVWTIVYRFDILLYRYLGTVRCCFVVLYIIVRNLFSQLSNKKEIFWSIKNLFDEIIIAHYTFWMVGGFKNEITEMFTTRGAPKRISYDIIVFLIKWDFTLITWNTPKQFVITNFCCSVFFLGDQNCKSYNFSHELNQKWKQQITKKLIFVWISRTMNFVRKYRFLSCAFFIFSLRETAMLKWFKKDVLEVLR